MYLFFGIVLFFSCEREYHSFSVDCDTCEPEEPEYGKLLITLTINDKYPLVPVTIYAGKKENENEVAVDTVDTSKVDFPVKLNEYYTVVAEYNDGNRKIFVQDGDKIKTKLVTDECEENCYMIKGGYYDVRLKYDE